MPLIYIISISIFWLPILLYVYSTVWWVIEITLLSWGWRATDTKEWGLDAVEVRVLTIGEEDVVQRTVDHVPSGVSGIKVISETAMEITGAEVCVVNDEFESTAKAKGRAHHWALEEVDCETEYVLYLDEDTKICERDEDGTCHTALTGIPDADFIQFTEKPESVVANEEFDRLMSRLRSGQYRALLASTSVLAQRKLTYLCEIFRMGYQTEQFAFHRLAYPLYAWGGGFAVRRSFEQRVGWEGDTSTITEDTYFVWRAAELVRQSDAVDGIDYQLVNTRFRNQAPKSIPVMIEQRRRWLSGTMTDMHAMPVWYYPLAWTRLIVWALSPVFLLIGLSGLVPTEVLSGYGFAYLLALIPLWIGSPLLVVLAATSVFAKTIPASGAYQIGGLTLFATLYLFMLAGLVIYRDEVAIRWWPLCLLLTPLIVFLHGVGAVYGVVAPADEFKHTPKD